MSIFCGKSSGLFLRTDKDLSGGTALADKVKSLKTGTTGITRVEICSNSANIAELMASPGPGSNTRLYKNLAALKAAWNIDAFNNDDEAVYDFNSTVTFASMVGDVGLKYTLAPYTMQSFWASVVSKLGATLVDRVYLQCYDGGANNLPSEWYTELGTSIVPLVWVTNDAKPTFGMTPEQAKTKFSDWDAAGGVAGAGYWNDYDIEKLGSSYPDYGSALTSVFP